MPVPSLFNAKSALSLSLAPNKLFDSKHEETTGAIEGQKALKRAHHQTDVGKEIARSTANNTFNLNLDNNSKKQRSTSGSADLFGYKDMIEDDLEDGEIRTPPESPSKSTKNDESFKVPYPKKRLYPVALRERINRKSDDYEKWVFMSHAFESKEKQKVERFVKQQQQKATRSLKKMAIRTPAKDSNWNALKERKTPASPSKQRDSDGFLIPTPPKSKPSKFLMRRAANSLPYRENKESGDNSNTKEAEIGKLTTVLTEMPAEVEYEKDDGELTP